MFSNFIFVVYIKKGLQQVLVPMKLHGSFYVNRKHSLYSSITLAGKEEGGRDQFAYSAPEPSPETSISLWQTAFQ